MRAEAEGSGVPTYDGGSDPEYREVEATQAALLTDPILGGLIEFG